MSTMAKEEEDNVDFWLLQCKNQILISSEWKEFVIKLQEKVQQLLFKSHVFRFMDLSRPEKVLLIEQAAENVDQSVSCGLHHQISACVKHIVSDYAINAARKDDFILSDIITDLIHDWISSLLKKRPHLRSKIGIFFNQPLRGKLRQLTWNCLLCTSQVFSHKPKPDEQFKPPRQLENEIGRHCKEILHEINLQSLNGSTTALKAMKAMVYNYCSACGVTSLTIEDFLLTIPFLLTMAPFTSRELPQKKLTDLVEEYLCFMTYRPSYMLESNQDFKTFIEIILQLLTQKYPTTAETYSDVFSASGQGASEDTDSLTENMMTLLKPVVQGMFVAYFNPEVLLYVWDQFCICGEVPGLSSHWIRVVIVISLFFLENDVRQRQQGMNLVLLEKWPLISMAQVQYEVQRNFQQDFKSLLESVHLPTCHSTADASWFSYPFVLPSSPEFKRTKRERENLEKKRYVQEQLEKNEEKKEKQIKSLREHFEEKYNHIKNKMESTKKENLDLLKQLNESQKIQDCMKIKAEEDIFALQVEISWLKSQVPRSTLEMSTPIIKNPLLHKNQDVKRQVSKSKSTYSENKRSVVKQFFTDYQKKIKSSMIPKAMILGDELEKVNSQIQIYVEDVKKAEIQLFQRRLRPGEISLMVPDIQKKTYDSILVKLEEILLEKNNSRLSNLSNN